MSLLYEIQSAVVKEGTDLGSILLKLRLLAARLGSTPLEEWVKHESEGYPRGAQLPDYRMISVAYRASFAGPFGSSINKILVPPYLIEKHGGEGWNRRETRQSISAIDDMVRRANEANEAVVYIEAANLVLLLADKIYDGYNCVIVTGQLSKSALVEIQQAVRSRILELTIKLEAIPEATKIGAGMPAPALPQHPEQVTQIANQVIHGNVTYISSNGSDATFNIAIQQGDQKALIEALVKAGLPHPDAEEFGQIVASEDPESKTEPFGSRAKTWVVENLKKAASGTWKVGVSVATEVLKEAAKKYYGL